MTHTSSLPYKQVISKTMFGANLGHKSHKSLVIVCSIKHARYQGKSSNDVHPCTWSDEVEFARRVVFIVPSNKPNTPPEIDNNDTKFCKSKEVACSTDHIHADLVLYFRTTIISLCYIVITLCFRTPFVFGHPLFFIEFSDNPYLSPK